MDGGRTSAACAIAEVLKTRLKASPPDKRPGNTEAYTAYLKGHLLWLQTALDEHEPYLAAAAVSPIYDQLRSNRIFRRLLQSTGFDL
jgi:hypothetical protein